MEMGSTKRVIIRMYYCDVCKKRFDVESLDVGIGLNAIIFPTSFEEQCGHWNHHHFEGVKFTDKTALNGIGDVPLLHKLSIDDQSKELGTLIRHLNCSFCDETWIVKTVEMIGNFALAIQVPEALDQICGHWDNITTKKIIYEKTHVLV